MSTGSPIRSLLGSLALLLTPTYCNIHHWWTHLDESNPHTHTHWCFCNCRDPVSVAQSLGRFSLAFTVAARLPTRRTGSRPLKANLFSAQPLKIPLPYHCCSQTCSLAENVLLVSPRVCACACVCTLTVQREGKHFSLSRNHLEFMAAARLFYFCLVPSTYRQVNQEKLFCS